MFVKRYHITEGATTTAGGIVTASSRHASIDGAARVLEGDPVDCPACGTRGAVKCVAPRLAERVGDKAYALSDDLCVCACDPPPKLVAAQDCSYQSVSHADQNPMDAVE